MVKWAIPVLLSLFVAVLSACNPLGSGKDEVSRQLVAVTRGDLTVSVTGNGYIEAGREVNLSFGVPGRIAGVYVDEGDVVTKGQVLARLDAGNLELAVSRAEVALSQAELALTQARLNRQLAGLDLVAARDRRDALDLAVYRAEIDLKLARYNLDKAEETYTWPDIEIAQADVNEARAFVEYAQLHLNSAQTLMEIDTWSRTLALAQAKLEAAEARLKAKLGGFDTEEVAIKKMQVSAAEKALAQAKVGLDRASGEILVKDAQVELAVQSVAQSHLSGELAQKSLAQSRLDLAQAAITAPYDAIVAGVKVEEGDTVSTTTPAVHLVEAGHLELMVDIDEIDMPDVRLGQAVVIDLDSLPGVLFDGKITSIYPVPRRADGVVLYQVKIEFDTAGNSLVRIGMSATAEVIVDQRQGVLLLPSRAIEEGKDAARVRVMANGEVQDRTISTGISDGLRTEVLSGLEEGDTVVIETRTVKPPSAGFF